MKLLWPSFATVALMADPSSLKGANAVNAQRGNKLKRLDVKASARQAKSTKGRDGAAFRTVYTMSNLNPNNEILIYSADAGTGELTLVGQESTTGSGGGFLGGGFLDATDAVVVAGQCLLAVNAGSGDVSSFTIESESTITLSDKTPSGGTLPVSLAWMGEQVFVLNAGGNGSIQGMRLGPDCSLTRAGGPIELNQNVTSVENFRPGLVSPSQIGFTPDGQLLALIKANDGGPGEGSFNLYQYPANGAADPDSLEQIFIPGDGAAPYAWEYLPDGRLVVIDAQGDSSAAEGELRTSENTSGQLRLFSETFHQHDAVSTGEFGSCWLAYNPVTSTVYTSNTPVNTISTFVVGEELELVSAVAAEQALPVDMLLSPDYDYLYVTACNFSPAPIIFVYETTPEHGLVLVQTVDAPVNCGLGLAQYIGSGAQGLISAKTA